MQDLQLSQLLAQAGRVAGIATPPAVLMLLHEPTWLAFAALALTITGKATIYGLRNLPKILDYLTDLPDKLLAAERKWRWYWRARREH